MNLVELGSPSSTPYSPHPPAPLKVPILGNFGHGQLSPQLLWRCVRYWLKELREGSSKQMKEWRWESWDLGSVSLSKLTQTSFRPQTHLYECWEDWLISARALEKVTQTVVIRKPDISNPVQALPLQNCSWQKAAPAPPLLPQKELIILILEFPLYLPLS